MFDQFCITCLRQGTEQKQDNVADLLVKSILLDKSLSNLLRSASLLATELNHQVADFLVEGVRLLPSGSLAVHSDTVLGATDYKNE